MGFLPNFEFLKFRNLKPLLKILLWTLIITAFHLGLASIVVSSLLRSDLDEKEGWGETQSDWDTISAAVTLLLATFLPMALGKYSDVLSSFEKLLKKGQEVQRLFIKNSDNTEAHEIIKNNIYIICKDLPDKQNPTVFEHKTNLKEIYNTLDPDNEPQMDRLAEFEDCLAEFCTKRKYVMPPAYLGVLFLVLLVFFGIILPYAKCKPPHRYHALVDVALIGFVNNLIFVSGWLIEETLKIQDKWADEEIKRQLAVRSRSAASYFPVGFSPLLR